MRQNRNKRKYVIIGLCLLLVIMAIGFSAFSTILNINGTAEITSSWDVEITNVETIEQIGDATNKENPTYTYNTANLKASFIYPGDSIKYRITVSNLGSLDAVIDSAKLELDDQNVLIHKIEGIDEGEALNAGASKSFTLTITFNEDITSSPSVGNVVATLKLNYLQNGNSTPFSNAEGSTSDTITINSLDLTPSEKSITAKINSTPSAYKYYYSIDEDVWYESSSDEYTINDLKPNTNYTVYVKAEDSSGEVVKYSSTTKTTDTTKPKITIEIGNHTLEEKDETNHIKYDYYKNLDINVTATDNDAVDNVKYCISSSECEPNTNLTLNNDSATVSMPSASGEEILCVKATDKIGLNNTKCSNGYKVDKSLPTITSMEHTTKYSSVTINITASDVHSGIYKYMYSKDGGTTFESSDNDSYTFNNLDDGEYTFVSKVIDNAGNESTPSTENVTVSYPLMMSGPNFQTKIDSVKSTVTEIEFVDTDEVTPPTTIDNTSVWDVSAKQNDSVIAWLDGTKMYIGGKGGVIGNSDSSSLFSNMNNVISIDFDDNFDTSNIKNMYGMFADIVNNGSNSKMKIEEIKGLENFDTSNVTNMVAMFQNCGELTELDLSNFDTSKVKGMNSMFNGPNDYSSRLEGIIFGDKWNTSNVTNMNYMFADCVSLLNIDLSNFNTSKVTTMQYMFGNCGSLTSLDVSNFNTSKVTIMNNMFFNCGELTELNLSNFDTSNVTDMESMFNGPNDLSSKLEVIILGKNFNTSKVTKTSHMFNDNPKLKTIYAINDFSLENITNSTAMFTYDTNLVGGNGTVFDSNYTDKTRALIDRPGQVGYFTDGGIPIIRNVSNVSTTNSITLIVDSWIPNGDGASKIEYSIDGGSTWHEQTNSSIAENIYTFTGLDESTTYQVKVRITSENNKVTTKEFEFTTKTLNVPTYEDDKEGTLVITYPSVDGKTCSNGLTCDYSLDNGTNWTSVNTDTKEITYTESGNIIARISDGHNTVSSSFAIVVEVTAETVMQNLGASVVTSGNGIYADEDEDGRYIFKGNTNTPNYINIKENGTDVKYRIYSVESDGSIKVIRDESIKNMNFDANNSSRRKSGYCTDNYCNAWAKMDSFTNGTQTGAVSRDSSIKEYIDGTYAPILDDYDKIVTKTWNISGTTHNRDTIANTIADESRSKWSGKVALLTVSEYVRANSNISRCGTLANLGSNYSICKNTNYLYKSSHWWLLSPDSSDRLAVQSAHLDGFVGSYYTYNYINVRPSFYLCPGLTYGGSGTSSDPYYISGGSCINSQIVYRWSTAEWTAKQDISGMKEGTDYVKKASDVVNMDSRGATNYLKHLVEGNIVTESYYCFVTDTEHCLRGGTENGENPSNYYPGNVSVLTAQQSWFKNQNGTCYLTSDNYSRCYSDTLLGYYAYIDGYVYGFVPKPGLARCEVFSDGRSRCHE